MMKTKILSLLITSIALTGCGGGGDSSNKESLNDIKTGVFTDSPVQGLYYETKTLSGLTNAAGEFSYRDGEMVTFKLGGTVLGVAPGQSLHTPFSISGVKPLSGQNEITQAFLNSSPNSFEKAINIATLLQNLDSDGDQENGINLSDAHNQLSSMTIPLFVKAPGFESNLQFNAAKSQMGLSHNISFIQAAQNMYSQLGIQIESNLTSKQTNNTNKGFLEIISFEYDEEGRLTDFKVDKNNDGIIDTTLSYTYDEQNRLRTIHNSSDNSTQTITYDEQNKVVSRSTKIGETPKSDESFEYEESRLSKFTLDKTADGISDYSASFSYDSDNNLSGYQMDTDGDTLADKSVVVTHKNGKISRFTETNSDDTSLDIAYTYDNKGNRKSQNIQNPPGSSVPYSNAKFFYDTNNNLSRYELDKNLDGKADYIEGYKHNLQNQRTLFRRDNNGDGNWDFVAQYFYDANGKRIKMIEDSDGNGVVDKTWEANFQAAVLPSTWDEIATKF